MIHLKELTKIYPNGFKALDNLNLFIGPNEFVYLVGASGAGKSTLLNLIFKKQEPTSGDLYIDNFPLSKIKKQKIPFLRRNIGVIFQDYKLLPKRTVFENIAFALRVMHFSRKLLRKQVIQVLELVGLAQKMNSHIHELSGGEQQRACIARAIVNSPPILIADEPTGSLDPETSWGIMQILAKINSKRTTVLIATHDRLMVDEMRKRVVVLDKGRMVSDQQLGKYRI
ncbi:cell division ATP-binding protein FtsE [Candidatus Margulisiibacteriota bacterium]